MKFIVAVFYLLLVASCKSRTSTKWSKAERDAFRENCVVNSKAELGEERSVLYCECMLEKVEARYPNVNDAGKITLPDTREMAKECFERLPLIKLDSTETK